MTTVTSASAPFHVMTKPVGPICNLGCKYCFYLEKEKLFGPDETFRMPDDLLESYIRQYIEAQPQREVSFAWQGGEPTLLGRPYFEKIVSLQKKHAGGKIIRNALQTNGTKLDDGWCEFLAEHGFLVGISLDGPPKLHDTYRVDKRGGVTYPQVIRGLRLLRKHNVEFNTLTVVHRKNAAKPLEVYRFLRDIGSGYLQFIPLVERMPDGLARAQGLDWSRPGAHARDVPVTEWTVEAEAYGAFLTAIFDEWVRRDVGTTFVQLFDVALGHWLGRGSSLCYFSETCGRALAVEHDGGVYSCDHYVYPEWKLGSLRTDALGDMVESEAQVRFGRDKKDSLPGQCRRCPWKFACNGECPKHRFITTKDGEPGLNYLCRAYEKFFAHVDPSMKIMADLIRRQRPPAEIMRMPR